MLHQFKERLDWPQLQLQVYSILCDRQINKEHTVIDFLKKSGL